MERIIMHIDVNNAFLSWSAIDLLNKGYSIDIRNIEAIIGGDEKSRHGIVLAKSMPAKKRGVKTAETIRSAKIKCNDLKIYPPNYKWYQKESNAFLNLIKKYTPDIEVISIDECFIDYSKVKKIYGDEFDFAHKLKSEIKTKLGFTVNVGIGNNKLCAKMASDFEKPDKVHTLYTHEIESKLYPLPIEDLFGVGKSTSLKLKELGIEKIGALAKADEDFLYKYFKNQAIKLINSARGIDNSLVISEKSEAKGISNSVTTSYNLNSIEEIYKVLSSLCDNVCITLRKKNKYASVISVILKDKFFKTKIHQRKLLNATNSTEEILKNAKLLVREMWNEESVRLVGISLNKLSSKSEYQLSLFEDLKEKDNDNKLDKTIDELKSLYGNNIIKKASLIESKVSRKYQ